MPKLSIVMPTYREPYGVFFTVQSLLLLSPHRSSLHNGNFEIVILDNCPGSNESVYLRDYVDKLRWIPHLKFISKFAPRCAALAKDSAICAATSPIVVCIDAHVALESGAFEGILDLLDDPGHADVLLHGPLLDFEMKVSATHMRPGFNKLMWGFWENLDRLPDKPWEIGYMGWVRLIPFFLKGVAGDPALNQADGIHPTGEGYKVLVETVYPYVTEAIQERAKGKRTGG